MRYKISAAVTIGYIVDHAISINTVHQPENDRSPRAPQLEGREVGQVSCFDRIMSLLRTRSRRQGDLGASDEEHEQELDERHLLVGY